MNDGKVCISVCAETADEFVEKIKIAAELADVVEIRFDCLSKSAPEDLFSELKKLRDSYGGKLLATFRPRSQGGKSNLTDGQRKNFWNNSGVSEFVDWADLEEDIPADDGDELFGKAFGTIIKSHHNFTESPEDIIETYKKLSTNGDHISKIAVQAESITDSLPVWRLLKTSDSKDRRIIPIAMGEAGKWTRILGLAHGSPLTYSSLEEGNETAPGQISARDLLEVYRVKELDEQTEIYGIIGNPVSHSLSPYIHNAAFKEKDLSAVYIPLEVSNLDEFIKRMVRLETREIDWNLRGFSVTAPHKEAIMKHLDLIDEAAGDIGAVNTVKMIDGRLCGYNTDADGFIEPLRKTFGDLKNAEVGLIGSGGAARACVYALRKDGANVTIFARNEEKGTALANEFEVNFSMLAQNETDFSGLDILVNASPLGTLGPLETLSPVTADQVSNLQLAYDLVYNPFETFFLREAKCKGVKTISGFEMLIAQATRQFEIWTGSKVSKEIITNAALLRLQKINIDK